MFRWGVGFFGGICQLGGCKSFEIFKTKMGDIPVICKKDLIIMKEASGRPQDLEDVKALRKL